jgi:uncharacterized protein with HEPN domain
MLSVSRDWRLYWDDIVTSCDRVQKYTQGFDWAAFESDQKTIDAVVRNLEIIGEAAKNLPLEARDLCPEIEWRKISGLRDIVAHAYFGIDKALIWDVVQVKVPELLNAMRRGGAV